MKIKFSKVLAIVCALSVAFAGLTAFAAGEVTTITTYDANNNADVDITVTSTVTGAEANKEVTYYVNNADGIVYINQKTADENGDTSFIFKAKQGDVIRATAKFGTDAATNAFPTFTFAEGINYLTEGTATATVVSYGSQAYIPVDENGTEGAEVTASHSFKAKVSGAAVEYGIKIGDNLYPAAGCSEVDGTYMVVINGNVNFADKTVYAYAKKADGTVVPSSTAFTIE